MGFGSSQDLLYIVLSLCVLWFTVFLCWLLYQAGRVLRNANRMVESILQKIETISDAMHFIRQRVDKMSSSMGIVTGLVGNIVEKMLVGSLEKRMSGRGKKKKEE